jgi:quinol monooxygenase YgiN
MRFARIYALACKPGSEGALERALNVLVQKTEHIAGHHRTTVLRDRDDALAYTVIEHWQSSDHHRASALEIPKNVFQDIMAVLAGAPATRDFFVSFDGKDAN